MISRKLLFLLPAFLLSLFANAGHEVGGVIITYESVAQVNNNEFEYVLTAYQVYERQGPPSSNTIQIDLSSGCYPNRTLSLPRVSTGSGGLLTLLGSDYCTPSTNIQTNQGLAVYQDTIILNGKCSNFLFSFSGFSRYNLSTNLATSFTNSYFQVSLNNQHGPNSSPTLPLSEFIQAACLNKPLELYGFNETDGDSMFYNNSVPLSMSGSTISPLTYNAGYNANNQVGSSMGYVLDPATGVLSTTLTSPGTYIITIRYSEYRIDTATQQMINVGVGRFSFTLIGAASCNSDPFELTHRDLPNADSLQCGDSTLLVSTTRKVESGSITPSGSEFDVMAFNAGPLSVTAARLLNDTLIEISLSQPVPGGNMISVSAVQGTDSDVIRSVCGKEMTAYADTLWFFAPASGTVAAAFSHSSNLLNVSFSSAGTSSNTRHFSWDFGDGSPKATTPNPSHTYAAAGTYTVVLVAMNDCGVRDSVVQTIQVCDSLIGAFSLIQAGDSVFLDASSSVGATQFFWEFGDGNSASGATTSHQYTGGGNYLISLNVVNRCGDTATFMDSVNVCPAPVADWTYNIVSTSGSGMVVDFDGTISYNAQKYVWDFGDGTQDSSSLTPTHTYATPSLSYRVSLTIYNICGGVDVRSFRLSEIGLQEVSGNFSVEFYPNPATDILQLEWNSQDINPDLLQVYSLDGQKLLERSIGPSEQLEARMTLGLAGLPKATYLLTLAGEGIEVQKKLVIKR